MDRISKLPSGIIETILCLLPIQDAGRTSILARDWRYRWTKIPKLAFIENTFEVSTELSVLEKKYHEPSKRRKMDKRCKLFYAIYQVLLMHQGPIQEFTLTMSIDSSCVEIDHIVLHLSSKNTVKILRLDLREGYNLPVSLFSLHQLTDLYLSHCALHLQPSFNGFGSLTNLYLEHIWTSEKTLMRFLSGCPLLKRLTLNSDCSTIIDRDESSIVDLFECLPVIEYLSVWLTIVVTFLPHKLPKELPTSLVHLKHLCMELVYFCHPGLPFLALLIRSSPNLEKLKLNMSGYDEDDFDNTALKDYSDIVLEHLKELEIGYFCITGYLELDVLKLILAKSPVLKKVKILLTDKSDKLRLSQILSNSPTASPGVKITITGYY